jgi:hypothetical protein
MGCSSKEIDVMKIESFPIAGLGLGVRKAGGSQTRKAVTSALARSGGYAAVFDVTLDEAELLGLDGLDEGFRTCWDPSETP